MTPRMTGDEEREAARLRGAGRHAGGLTRASGSAQAGRKPTASQGEGLHECRGMRAGVIEERGAREGRRMGLRASFYCVPLILREWSGGRRGGSEGVEIRAETLNVRY